MGATIVLTKMIILPVLVLCLHLCRSMEKTQKKLLQRMIKILKRMKPYFMCWKKGKQALNTRGSTVTWNSCSTGSRAGISLDHAPGRCWSSQRAAATSPAAVAKARPTSRGHAAATATGASCGHATAGPRLMHAEAEGSPGFSMAGESETATDCQVWLGMWCA